MTNHTSNERREIIETEKHNSFGMFPYMVIDGLKDMYEIALYIYYMRVGGAYHKPTEQTERTIAKRLGMGRDKFRETRAILAAKGCIKITEEGTPNAEGVKGTVTKVVVVDLIPEGTNYCLSPERRVAQGLPPYPQKWPCPPKEVDGPVEDPSPQDEIPNGVDGPVEDPSPPENGDKGPVEGRKGLAQGCKLESLDSPELENPLERDGAGAAVEGVGDKKQPKVHDPVKAEQLAFYQRKALEEEEEEAASKTVDSHSRLLAHPLTVLFMNKRHLFKLNKDLAKLLTEDIRIENDKGGAEIYPRGLIAQWNDQVGFDEFVKERIPQLLAAQPKTSDENLLRHLRNLHRPGPQLPGFWEWRRLNPHLCNTVAPASREVKTVIGESGDDPDAPTF